MAGLFVVRALARISHHGIGMNSFLWAPRCEALECGREAAAFLPASLLAGFRVRARFPASKLAGGKAAASRPHSKAPLAPCEIRRRLSRSALFYSPSLQITPLLSSTYSEENYNLFIFINICTEQKADIFSTFVFNNFCRLTSIFRFPFFGEPYAHRQR